METVHSTPSVIPSEHAPAKINVAILAVAAVFLWAPLLYKLTTDWSTNTQYEFGYFVPLLMLHLLGRRWADRPSASGSIPAWILLSLGVFALFLVLPVRLVQEANPDWRPLNWVHAALVIFITLLPVAYAGGLRWVRHFIFPILLILSAIPWPLAIEQSVIQGLARAVSSVTVELLGWTGIPAIQRGNVIELPTGPLGVADACSGVRSLAGTLMASLFFGEYYRLRTGGRLALVAGGMAIAFVLNLCRTFFLSWRAAAEGLGAVAKWHDSAGYMIFLVAFGALWLLAATIRSQDVPAPTKGEGVSVFAKFQPAAVGIIIAWLLVAEVLTQGWYRYRASNAADAAVWAPKWPALSDSFHFLEIPDEARAILRYTDGAFAMKTWPDGRVWQLFFFRWDAGRTSAQLAVMHRPEICLPAAGFRYVSTSPSIPVRIGNLELPFEASVFDSENGRTFIFRCLWDDRKSDATRGSSLDMSIRGRLKGAWIGRRNEGQRLLQVCILGAEDENEARHDLESRLPSLIEELGAAGA